MGLSSEEIRVLNEIARETAEADPAYGRRMMSYELPKRSRRSRTRGRANRRNREGRKDRRAARVGLPVYAAAGPEPVHSPLPLLPALMLGIFIIVAIVSAFGVVVQSADYTHARPSTGASSQVR
jgi:hypothetical protein